MTDMDDAELDRHFAAARARPPEPDAAFMARAMAEARAHQPPAVAARPPLPSGRGAAVLAWLAGVAMPGGLIAATLVGVLIGVSSGDLVSDQAAVLMETDLGMELVYRFPAIGGFFEEI
ncbi:MAG: hypothetical protein NXH97_04520 [Rhodobacteraceae bacterium]|nr:hypothetical protein [Paracoccaceae bacterium]